MCVVAFIKPKDVHVGFQHVGSSSSFGTLSQKLNTSCLESEGQTVKVLSESTQIRSLQETKNRQSSCLLLPM